VHHSRFGAQRYRDVGAWMGDLLALWKEADWGWVMWNLRGEFGIVDSEREDVAYENFHGHKLDRRTLELLLAN
jgi:endoglucanase